MHFMWLVVASDADWTKPGQPVPVWTEIQNTAERTMKRKQAKLASLGKFQSLSHPGICTTMLAFSQVM